MKSPDTANHEIARLAALRSYAILDTARDLAFDRLVLTTAQIFRVPVAGIAFLDADRLWFKAQIGLDLRQEPGRIGACIHAILSKDVLVIEDTAGDPRIAVGPFVPGKPFYRFYAGAPLIADAGLRLGTLCVLDYQPRSPPPRHIALLAGMAQEVMRALEHRRDCIRRRLARRSALALPL